MNTLLASSLEILKISFLFALTLCTEGYLIRQSKDFIIAFSDTRQVRAAGIIFTSVEENADLSVNVSAPLLGNFIYRFTSIHSGKIQQLSEKLILNEISEERNGVYIRSSHDIILEGYVAATENIGGFLAIPVSSLGSRYLAITYCPNHNCVIVIVGTSRKTSITIDLRIANGGDAFVRGRLYKNGEHKSTMLNKFETIRLYSSSDLSGSEIVSSKPIAVFCGGDFIKAIVDWGDSGHDQIVEQLPPLSALGTRYIPLTFPFPEMSETVNFLLKIVCVYDETVVHFGNGYIRMSKGKSKEFLLNSSSLHMLDGVMSSKPILLAEISPSWPAFKSVYGKQHNDASMIVLEPLDISEPYIQQVVATRWHGTIISMVNLVFLRPAVCHNEAVTLDHGSEEISLLTNSKWEVRVLYDVSEFTLVSSSVCPVIDGFLYRTGWRAGGAAGLPLVRNTSMQVDSRPEQNFLELCPNTSYQLLDWIIPSRGPVSLLQMIGGLSL